MMAQVSSWWDKLTQKEKDLLLEFLYNLNLEDYGIVIDEKTEKYVKDVNY